MQAFDTRDEVIKTFKTHAVMNGYVLVIGKDSENRHLYLHCDRDGQYRRLGINMVLHTERCPQFPNRKRAEPGLFISHLHHRLDAISLDEKGQSKERRD